MEDADDFFGHHFLDLRKLARSKRSRKSFRIPNILLRRIYVYCLWDGYLEIDERDSSSARYQLARSC